MEKRFCAGSDFLRVYLKGTISFILLSETVNVETRWVDWSRLNTLMVL